MRMLKQAVLTAGLLLIALFTLSLVRIRLTPAQAPQPGTGESTVSGDTNCDGRIDITDPIIVLNWLFGDGPEPGAGFGVRSESDASASFFLSGYLTAE